VALAEQDIIDQDGLVNVAVELGGMSLGSGVAVEPPVPAAPPAPLLGVTPARPTLADAVAAPGVRTPPAALRSAPYPTLLRSLPPLQVQAGAALLSPPVAIEADGVLTVSGFIGSGAEPAAVQLSVDGGETYASLNGGADETAGAWWADDSLHRVRVHRGDLVQVRLSASTAIGALRVGLLEGF
jgi:hypothetical protein